jgi:hypothetical protein
MKKLVLLIASLALIAAACGGGENDAAALPVYDGADQPAIDTACLVGEPDCNDAPGGEPQDLPPPGDEPGTSDGFVVDGGLTVTDALETDATGIIAVSGFIVADAAGVRLCEALAESFPPQCGGPSILLEGLEQIDPDELSTEGDVSWTDYAVTVFGELTDGTLVADPLSQ